MVSPRERTAEEIICDTILALCILNLAQERASAGDRWKAMKMLFISEYRLLEERIKALNMRFYRHQQGPFSEDANDAWKRLANCGYIVRPRVASGKFIVTDEGSAAATQFLGDVHGIGQNEAVLGELYRVADEYGTKTGKQIKDEVYEMRVRTPGEPAKQRRVRAIRPRTILAEALDAGQAAAIFQIPHEWFDTLDVVFDPDYDSDAMKKASRLSHEELFG